MAIMGEPSTAKSWLYYFLILIVAGILCSICNKACRWESEKTRIERSIERMLDNPYGGR